MTSEERTIQKISKILSRLDPETASRVAASVATEFAIDAAGAGNEAEEQKDVAQGAAKDAEDARPSFLRTQFRIEVGKELLEREKSADTSAGGRRRP